VGVLPALLAEVFRRTRPLPGDERLSSEARTAVRAASFGGLLMVAARTGAVARPALDAAANLGAGACAVGGLVALARLPATGGLLQPSRSARSLDGALFTGFLWGLATAIPGTYAMFEAPRFRFDPLVIDYATTSAGIGTLLVMVAATLRLRFIRRLELGIGDRSRSAFALSIAAFTIAVPAAWLDVAPPDRVLPAAVVVNSLACAWAATTSEATRVTRWLRGLLAVTLLGAPLLIAATLVAQAQRTYAPAVVLVSGTMAIAVGLVAHGVARPLGPEQSRWLIALDAAARDALQPEPSAALRATLVALAGAAPTANSRPEIWQRDPSQVLSVDIAGYLHVEGAQAPERIYELGMAEPERTLRTDVLKALQVRRPDVRAVLSWLEERSAFSATIVVDEDGPIGFILLPEASRSSPLTLEEARAARLLADRISSLLAVAAALARSRERETAAVARADATDDECRRLEHIIRSEADRYRAAAEHLARPASAAAYSASARTTLSELERLGKTATLAALVVPPGSDPVSWAAHLHLASPRSGGPFVVVDAARPNEQPAERWSDEERSPFRMADGGTLLVLSVLALPMPTQDILAIALSRRLAHAPRSAVLPPGVVIALPARTSELVSAGALSPHLARWFEDVELVLPKLSERSEDLRALALDALARRCVEVGRPPIGLDAGALRLLVEHTFPNNEAELASVVARALSVAKGPVLTAQDLTETGFRSEPAAAMPELTPLPPVARRRSSRRPPRAR
jgi:transcriptional regulator with AAA-type ATPase domain